jgi:hypothetical protein
LQALQQFQFIRSVATFATNKEAGGSEEHKYASIRIEYHETEGEDGAHEHQRPTKPQAED